MRFYAIIFFLFLGFSSFSQNNQDTTIYHIAEKQPSFPVCDFDWLSDKEKDSCKLANLMYFLGNNLRYPSEAREKNIMGRVVVQFVVEKNGTITNIKTLKDIGGGCGEEAIRIINLMNVMNIKWNPGITQGVPVRVNMVLPVQFKLTEDPGYNVVDGIPIFYLLDKALKLKDSTTNINAVLQKNLKKMAMLNDSCKVGVMQTEIVVFPDASAKLIQLDDFFNLGSDAQFEAIQAVTKTAGAWIPAEYKGKKVPTSQVARIVFKPDAPKCKSAVENFEKAYTIMQEAVALTEKKEDEASLLKFNDAVKMMPNNMEFLYLRGIVNMNLNKKADACSDLTKVKTTLNVNWVDNLLPLLCN